VITGAVARPADGGLVLEPSGERLEVQRVVAVPRLLGPAVAGLAADDEGFVLIGEDGRVAGAERTWAVGDGVDAPLKFGHWPRTRRASRSPGSPGSPASPIRRILARP